MKLNLFKNDPDKDCNYDAACMSIIYAMNQLFPDSLTDGYTETAHFTNTVRVRIDSMYSGAKNGFMGCVHYVAVLECIAQEYNLTPDKHWVSSMLRAGKEGVLRK